MAVLMVSFCTQGVLKVRKRVTLMVVSVSAIFAIFFGTDMTLHILQGFGNYKFNSFAFPITHTMVMSNSAVNPFAYALINQQFRRKIKGMVCCNSSSSAKRIHLAREPKVIELDSERTHPTNTAERGSTESSEYTLFTTTQQ